MENNHSSERYARQLILKEFGAAAQAQLLKAKVLVVGAGGLGCPALQYLTAAGVGSIGIIDDDVVQLTNLHRQVLYKMDHIGHLKAPVAAEVLGGLNPTVELLVFTQRLTASNAWSIVEGFDVVIDGTDNFATRYMINDLCVLLGKTLVHGAVSGYQGQVAVFNKQHASGAGVNYRDLFPRPPAAGEVLNCAEAGVLGVLPGIIGTMQANETIKLITGVGSALINQVLTFNALTNDIFKFEIKPSPVSAHFIPQSREAFEKIDYEWLCSVTPDSAYEIDPVFFNTLMAEGAVDVIDVRQLGELPQIHEFNHLSIPITQLEDSFPHLQNNTIVCVCQSGLRSRQATKILRERFGNTKKIYSLRGGILHWKKL